MTRVPDLFSSVADRIAAPRAVRLTAERQKRVDALISVPCDDCQAGPGQSCSVPAAPSLPVCLMDRQNGTCAHMPRMIRAVQLGRISYDDYAAQFPGHLTALIGHRNAVEGG